MRKRSQEIYSEMIRIGRRIGDARRAKKYDSYMMADLLDMSPGNYRRLEAGSQLITTKTLYELGQILEVSVDYLLYGETESGSVAKVRSLFKGKKLDDIKTAIAILEVFLDTCPSVDSDFCFEKGE